MPFSYTDTTGVPAQQTYSFPFETLDGDFVYVLVDEVAATFTVDRVAQTVTISSPVIVGGEAIRIFRMTDSGDDDRIIDPTNLASLSEVELDKLQLQLLHAIQEVKDALAGSHGSIVIIGPGGVAEPLAPGTDGDVLTTHGPDTDPTWETPVDTGEANTSSNAGAGVGLAKAKVGVDLPFKTLVSSDGSVGINGSDPDEIDLTAPTNGEANTSSNDGAGAQLAKAKVGLDLPFRTITSTGGTITVTQGADEVNLEAVASGEANTSSNDGAGAQLAKAKVGVDLPFRTITSSGGSVTVTQGADTVNLEAAGEANTSSNSGAGTGLAKAKVGVDLPFKSLTSSDSSIIIDGADPDVVDVTVDPNLIPDGNVVLALCGQGNSLSTISCDVGFIMPAGFQITRISANGWTTVGGATGTKDIRLRHDTIRGTSDSVGTAVHDVLTVGQTGGTILATDVTTTILSQPNAGDAVWLALVAQSGTSPSFYNVTVELAPV